MSEAANTKARTISIRDWETQSSGLRNETPLRVVLLAAMSDIRPKTAYSTNEGAIPFPLGDYANHTVEEILWQREARQQWAKKWLFAYLEDLGKLLDAVVHESDGPGLSAMGLLLEGIVKEVRCCHLAAEAANGEVSEVGGAVLYEFDQQLPKMLECTDPHGDYYEAFDDLDETVSAEIGPYRTTINSDFREAMYTKSYSFTSKKQSAISTSYIIRIPLEWLPQEEAYNHLTPSLSQVARTIEDVISN